MECKHITFMHYYFCIAAQLGVARRPCDACLADCELDRIDGLPPQTGVRCAMDTHTDPKLTRNLHHQAEGHTLPAGLIWASTEYLSVL